MELAESRRKNFEINPKEKQRFDRIHEEDFKRDMLSMPREHRRKQAKRAISDLTDEQLEELMNHMEEKKEEDPFAAPEQPLDENWGKFRIMTLAPNFEVSVLLCQLTGSIFYTDSETRWAEISTAAARCSPADGSKIARAIALESFPTSYNPVESLAVSDSDEFAEIRNILRNVQTEIVKPDVTPRKILTDILAPRFTRAMDSLKVLCKRSATNLPEVHIVHNKLDVLICPKGITHRHVERLMLANGFTPSGFPIIAIHLRKQRLGRTRI
jgi:hypothetical protein